MFTPYDDLDGPNYEEKPEASKVNPYKYVKLGELLKKLAVIELRTSEPIQFIVRTGTPQQMRLHIEQICTQWDLHFKETRKKRGYQEPG